MYGLSWEVLELAPPCTTHSDPDFVYRIPALYFWSITWSSGGVLRALSTSVPPVMTLTLTFTPSVQPLPRARVVEVLMCPTFSAVDDPRAVASA